MYVLYKNEPKVDLGEVVSVSAAAPQFQNVYNAGMIQPPKMVVDVKLKVGDSVIDLQKLPSDVDTADFASGMVVSERKDAIMNEIDMLRKSSEKVLESMDYHRSVVGKCGELLGQLNPQIAEDARRVQEMQTMRSDIDQIKEMLSQFLSTASSHSKAAKA